MYALFCQILLIWISNSVNNKIYLLDFKDILYVLVIIIAYMTLGYTFYFLAKFSVKKTFMQEVSWSKQIIYRESAIFKISLGIVASLGLRKVLEELWKNDKIYLFSISSLL